jgi:hypothetical protein
LLVFRFGVTAHSASFASAAGCEHSLGDVYGNHFKTLIETIQSSLLALPIAMALELAEEADRLSGMTAGIDRANFSADSSCRDCWVVIDG